MRILRMCKMKKTISATRSHRDVKKKTRPAKNAEKDPNRSPGVPAFPQARERVVASHPATGTEVVCRRGELPDGYGDNMIYLLVRDPYWIYAYWEIQKDCQEQALSKIGGKWDAVRSILRVFDVTDAATDPPYFDTVLRDMARSWYINVRPNRSYVVEIGCLHQDGRYVPMARSNEVRTPRAGMSEIIDEQWMGIDWDKMYALSGGFQAGKSSAELQKLMESHLKGALSSGSGAGLISSMGSPVKIRKRGFRFWLECELIIYGGTEPDAVVSMQGRPVKLRPDGTFTLRYALPDGRFAFDCCARSSDGIEERTITPVLERRTEKPSPVFRGNHPTGIMEDALTHTSKC